MSMRFVRNAFLEDPARVLTPDALRRQGICLGGASISRNPMIRTTVATNLQGLTNGSASGDELQTRAERKDEWGNPVSKTTHKKCLKGKHWVPREQFGESETSSDGLQSYCQHCKNKLGRRRREKNVRAYLRHHISTRVMDQLGVHTPKHLTRDLEEHLGYTIQRLIEALRDELHGREPGKKLRDALNEGYHVDHIRPLSSYIVIREGAVDWQAFRECWDPSNLRAIPAQENLQKGARYSADEDVPF